jgi:hypothetical protein
MNGEKVKIQKEVIVVGRLRNTSKLSVEIDEVKNAWRYTSTPQYVFMAWCLVEYRDNFTLIFYIRTQV